MKPVVLLLTLLAVSLPASAAGPSSPARITGVAGIAYDVKDIAQGRAYFEDFLGFREAFTLKNADGSDHAVFVKINDHQFIELIAEAPLNHGYLHGAMFETNDAKGMRARLAAIGVKVPESVEKDAAGNLGFEITDPSGFTLEIVQYLPNSMTGRGTGKGMPDSRIATHIDHVGLLLSNREENWKFYSDAFGFTKEGDGSKMVVGDGPDRFELGIDKKSPGIDRYHVKDHICLSVPNVPRVVAELNAKPAAKTYREIETHVLPNGKNVAELYDLDGNRVELMEPPKADEPAKTN